MDKRQKLQHLVDALGYLVLYSIVAVVFYFAGLAKCEAQQTLTPGEGTTIILRPKQPTITCYTQIDGTRICVTSSH